MRVKKFHRIETFGINWVRQKLILLMFSIYYIRQVCQGNKRTVNGWHSQFEEMERGGRCGIQEVKNRGQPWKAEINCLFAGKELYVQFTDNKKTPKPISL